MVRKIKNKVKHGKKIRVAFTAWNIAMWKYGSIYDEMKKSLHFDPFIILTPSPGKNNEVRERDLEEMKHVFSLRNYKIYPHVQDTIDGMRFEKEIKADILFFTQPYSIGEVYKNMLRFLFCYSAYGFPTDAPAKWSCNTIMQNMCWKLFQPTKQSISRFEEMQSIKGKNNVLVGYPFGEELRKSSTFDPWKKSLGETRLKRIIWASHFSITENAIFKLSNFLRLHQVMLELAEEFRGQIQWAFKPHPWLYSALCKNSDWGEKRAREYFKRWETLENTQLEQGNYTELFANSDAIIHDCGSFTVEYLYTQKPGMYIMIPSVKRSADGLGEEALDCYYQGSTKEEIRKFIINVVLGGNDPKARERKEFYDKYLLPPNGKTAAQNILDEIERGLGWK